MDTSKIIKGVVGGGRYTVTAPIIKEDYGLYLKIEGLELPSTYEVDFSNSEHNGTSVTMIGNSDGVLIPNQFISSGKDVFAFLYHVGADFGRTVYKFRIPNKLRPDRTGETPTPEQQSVIDQAISALNTAVAQTAQDVIDADASAQSASDDADRAEEAKTDAQNYASSANTSSDAAYRSASSAQLFASQAETSAQTAEQIKDDVEGMVDDAQASANASAQSASASANSASQASGYAQSASASAQSASGYASQAQTSAQTASAKATEASGYADTSSQKASESAQSASLALGYKNDALQAKTDAETAQGLAEQARDDAQTAQKLAETAESNAESTVHGVLDSLSLVETSGSIVETHDAFPVSPEKMVVDINPVQDLSHGDPSPENICPISGWTGMQVQKTGANILNPSANPIWDSRVYTLNQDGSVTQSGNDGRGWTSNNFTGLFLKKGQYILSFTAPNITCNLRTSIDGYTENYRTTNSVLSFTLTEDCIVKWKTSQSSYPVTYAVQLEVGTEATAYEPYNGTTIPISWQTEAGTVYGGKLDVLSGELVIDRAMVDLGTLNWNYVNGASGVKFFRSEAVTNAKRPSANAEATGAIFSTYATISAYDVYLGNIGGGIDTISNVRIYDPNYTDAIAFKQAMQGVQLCYELAEPIEYQLTLQQITLIKDYNALWADTGDISEFAYRIGEFATKADIPNVPVEDVQVNGTSVVQNKVANIDLTGIERNAEDIESLEEDRYKPYAVDSASGSIASFSDGADDIPLKSLVVDINPVQDLHGQDAPYPAGGGKNLFQTTAQSKTENGVTWTVNADGTIAVSGMATGYTDLVAGYARVSSNMGMVTISGISTATNISWGSLTVLDVNNNVLYTITTGGTTAVWSCDLSQYPDAYNIRVLVKRNNNNIATSGTVKIQVEKGSEATAYSPYENICPISGWTQVDVEQSGKNLFDSNFSDYIKPYDYYIKPIKLESGKRYVIKAELVGTAVTGTAFGITKKGNRYSEFSPYLVVVTSGTVASFEFTVDDTFTSPKLIVYVSGQAKFDEVMSNYNITLEVKADQNPYEPYTGRSITINLGQTVYGGKLDVLSGELVVDRAMVDLGTLNWGMSNTVFYSPSSPLFGENGTAKIGESARSICEIYQHAPVTLANPTLYRFVVANTQVLPVLRVSDDRFSSSADFKAAMSGIMAVFELVEPLTIQLTPNQLNSLYGVNNIWADSGDTEVEYRADTKLFIERLTAPDSADMIADANITSGKYFMVGNNLFKATSNIANGAQIVVGTNCIRKSLSEALNEINA